MTYLGSWGWLREGSNFHSPGDLARVTIDQILAFTRLEFRVPGDLARDTFFLDDFLYKNIADFFYKNIADLFVKNLADFVVENFANILSTDSRLKKSTNIYAHFFT